MSKRPSKWPTPSKIPAIVPAAKKPAPQEPTALQLAERLFGAATHTILLSDTGPAVSWVGWKLGTGRAESSDEGVVGRAVEVDIMFSEEQHYAICERVLTLDGAQQLDASVTVCDTAEDVRAACEATSMDFMRDAARRAALDHVLRFWPFLAKPKRSDSVPLPFAI